MPRKKETSGFRNELTMKEVRETISKKASCIDIDKWRGNLRNRLRRKDVSMKDKKDAFVTLEIIGKE